MMTDCVRVKEAIEQSRLGQHGDGQDIEKGSLAEMNWRTAEETGKMGYQQGKLHRKRRVKKITVRGERKRKVLGQTGDVIEIGRLWKIAVI